MTPTVPPPSHDLESVQEERALDFFADAAGHDRDDGEQPRIARRREQSFDRVLLDRMQPGQQRLDGEQNSDADTEHHKRQWQAESDLVGDAALPEQHVARALTVREKKHHDEADEQHRVDERYADDESDLQAATGPEWRDSRAP